MLLKKIVLVRGGQRGPCLDFIQTLRGWFPVWETDAHRELAELLMGKAPSGVIEDWLEEHGGERAWAQSVYAERTP